jgi:hypothetical protein
MSQDMQIPITYLTIVVAGKHVQIEAISWPKDGSLCHLRQLVDGSKQQPEHTVVIIVNSQFVAFL